MHFNSLIIMNENVIVLFVFSSFSSKHNVHLLSLQLAVTNLKAK